MSERYADYGEFMRHVKNNNIHSIYKLDINDLRTKLENLSLNFNDFSESHSGVLDELNIINDNYNELKVKTLGDYDGISSLYDLIQQAAASEDCLHLTGGSMTGDINVSGSHDIGSSASKWNNIYVNNINGNPISSIISQVAVNLGTANYLAYYSLSNQIDNTSKLYSDGNYLHILNDTDVSGTTTPTNAPFTIGTLTSQHIEIDNNEILSKSNGTTPSTLYLQDTTGYVEVAGSGLGVCGTNTGYNFYVNGTSYLNGQINTQDVIPITGNTYSVGSESYPYIYGVFNILYGGTNNNTWIRSNAASGSSYGIVFGYGGKTASTTLGKWTYTGLGIGTDSPAYKLDVAGDIKNTGAIWLGRDVTANGTKGIFWHTGSEYGIYRTSGSWTSNNYQQLKIDWPTGIIIDGGSSYGKSGVQVTGNFWATGAVTALQSSSSDKRLKKNIKPFNATEIVDKLKPVQFEWNNKAKKYNNNFKDGKNYGLIAQDSDGIIDDLVFDLPDGKGYKGVRYEKLIPILLQAIKEQQNEINELKKKMSCL